MRSFPDRDEAPQVHAAEALTPPTDGTVLVRIPVSGRGWPRELPRVPGGRTLTVTLGDAELTPTLADELLASGYRVAGVAADHRPLGRVVDVLVPADLQAVAPVWWAGMRVAADRIFDLRMGPVRHVLAAELALHRHAGSPS